MVENDDEAIGLPTVGEMMGAQTMVLTAIIQALKAKGLVDGEDLAKRIEGMADEKNASNKGMKLFAMIARHKYDDIGP